MEINGIFFFLRTDFKKASFLGLPTGILGLETDCAAPVLP